MINVHYIWILWKITNEKHNFDKTCLKGFYIFSIYIMLNFCCTDNEQNWPNLHFDLALFL